MEDPGILGYNLDIYIYMYIYICVCVFYIYILSIYDEKIMGIQWGYDM